MGIIRKEENNMSEGQKLKKVNLLYLLAYILLPVVILVMCAILVFRLVESSSVGAILLTALVILAVFWWSFLGEALYDKGQAKRMKALDEQGFVRNHTFTSDGCTVAVDLVHKQLAMMFRWNPGKTFVVPAGHITKAWVDDGSGGSGFLNGTSRVSFVFLVDGVKIRVNTFISNRRWRLESDNVLTGISKADVMVEVLNAAAGIGAQ